MKQITKVLCASLPVVGVFALIFAFCGIMPALAAERPFPVSDVTYERIVGTLDPNWDPNNPVGDGCLRQANPTLTHLEYFANSTSINPCDGVRVYARFHNQLKEGEEPTRFFRFGTVWQYRDITNPAAGYQWKPVENFLIDGVPVDPQVYNPANQDDVVIKDAHGNYVQADGNGYFEPELPSFFDEFGTGEHTFQYDIYFPRKADTAAMTWGTGSTGDAEGGSIGARASYLRIYLPGSADFRHVKDSDYREFLKIADTEKALPNRRLGSFEGEVAGSTLSIEKCLEDRQLAPVTASTTANKLYPDLPYKSNIAFTDVVGSFLFARHPYEFLMFTPGDFDPLVGLRPTFIENGEFQSYEKVRPGKANFGYKPSEESIVAKIPGYSYVDNDLHKYPKGGKRTAESREYAEGKNVKFLYNHNGDRVQHFYYTYKPNLTTFELLKTDGNTGKPVAGARFALYREADTREYADTTKYANDNPRKYACSREQLPPLEDLQVCAKDSDASSCKLMAVNKVAVPGAEADGTFYTDAQGKFVPNAAQWLEPGRYYLKELSAPQPYVIKSAVTELTVTGNEKINAVSVQNFAAPPPPPEIARTGFAGMGLLGLMGVVLLSGIGLLVTPRRFS